MFGTFARLIWRLLKRSDKSAHDNPFMFSRRMRPDDAPKQPEGYGGYTPPGMPTKPPPDGQEKK
jgi:hypothetical protein